MTTLIGEGHDRLDGCAKVTGAARYTAEFGMAHELYGALVLSTVAAGRVLKTSSTDAERVPGVVTVLTHRDAPRIPPGPYRTWLQDATIQHAGQPVAMVLAETERAARLAAALVRVEYDAQAPLPRLGSEHAQQYASPPILEEPAETRRGRPGCRARGRGSHHRGALFDADALPQPDGASCRGCRVGR